MRFWIASAIVIVSSVDASACIRSSLAYSFEDKINNEFSYLICLHNEQQELIAEQAQLISDLIQELKRQSSERGIALDKIEKAETLASRALVGIDLLKTNVGLIEKHINETDGVDVIPEIKGGSYIPYPSPKK